MRHVNVRAEPSRTPSVDGFYIMRTRAHTKYNTGFIIDAQTNSVFALTL